MTARLLADCGNTAVKLVRAGNAILGPVARLPPDPEAIAAWLRGQDDAGSLVAAPGAAASADALRSAWARAGNGRPLRWTGEAAAPVPDLGQYVGCGIDRVLAGLACDADDAGVVVVDAGTATTLTAWRRGPRFAGGLILPGPEACLAGLRLRAPALPDVAVADPDARADQNSTIGAIAAAIAIGYPAMVATCLRRLQGDAGCRSTLLTGGGAGRLRTVLPEVRSRPHLVLEGLLRLTT